MTAVLHDWSVVFDGGANVFTPPELMTIHLSGRVFGHPDDRHPDGKAIRTSAVVSAEGRIVKTRSGSTYRLGRISRLYRRWLDEHCPNWDWRNPITMVPR